MRNLSPDKRRSEKELSHTKAGPIGKRAITIRSWKALFTRGSVAKDHFKVTNTLPTRMKHAQQVQDHYSVYA